MAAVLPFLETEPEGQQDAFLPTSGRLGVIAKDEIDIDAMILKLQSKIPAVYKDIDKSVVPRLVTAHTALSRLQWARQLIAKQLENASYSVKVSADDVSINLNNDVNFDAVPWARAANELKSASLFSTNTKMRVPTFDLPAGHGLIGGSCPGALWGQSTVPLAVREKFGAEYAYAKKQAGGHIKIDKTVCENCYASGGTYGYTSTQFREIVIYAFVKSMMDTPENREKLKNLFVYAVTKTLDWSTKDKSTLMPDGRRIKPVRIHSSGDFFSPAYAKLWMDVAREVHKLDPLIRFWAPTRTHMLKQFADMWAQPGFIPGNFAIRASGYHVGDTAPRPVCKGGFKGTSVMTALESAQRHVRGSMKEFHGELDGQKADFQCGVYALEETKKTCASSINPDGKEGCRACWTRPDLAVNYSLH